MNVVNIMGRLLSDPAEEQAGSKTKLAFYVAVPRSYDRERYDAVRCSAWRSTADFVKKYFHKGDSIALTGHIGTWQRPHESGNSDTIMEVVADNVYFTGYRKKEENYEAPIEENQDLPFL